MTCESVRMPERSPAGGGLMYMSSSCPTAGVSPSAEQARGREEGGQGKGVGRENEEGRGKREVEGNGGMRNTGSRDEEGKGTKEKGRHGRKGESRKGRRRGEEEKRGTKR